MTAAQTSTPGGAAFWRIHCGSFVLNGYMGKVNDWLTDVYTRCMGGSAFPDVIAISADMFSPLVRAVAASMVISPLPPGSDLQAVVDAVVERIVKGDQFMPFKLYGSVVRIQKDLPDGTINFYIGERLVGETIGWTP